MNLRLKLVQIKFIGWKLQDLIIGFQLPNELEKKIKTIGKNKNLILILNSPNNPSGAVCNNLKELAKVAKNIN